MPESINNVLSLFDMVGADGCEGRLIRWLIIFDNIEDERAIEQL